MPATPSWLLNPRKEAMSQKLLADLKHVETVVSTIVGLGAPGDAPAKELAKIVKGLIEHVEASTSADVEQYVADLERDLKDARDEIAAASLNANQAKQENGSTEATKGAAAS